MGTLAKLSAATETWTQERVDLVKRTVCPRGISDDEFALFVAQCQRSGLDPLLKEAFCVPRRTNVGTREAPRWVTRHEFQPSEAGMLARAEKFPDFRGIQAQAVFSGDAIDIDSGDGKVRHTFNPTQRKGQLLGAWARVEREGKLATVVWLELAGYVQDSPLWRKIPATMMEKCARVAALRKAYPSAFGGLYIREEMPAEEAVAGETVDADAPAPLPAQAPTPALPAPRGGGVEEAKRRLQRARVPAVVDVQPNETEEEATARQAAAPGSCNAEPDVMGFGPRKGTPLHHLTQEELQGALTLAEIDMKTNPGSPYFFRLQDEVKRLRSELARRSQ